MNQLSRRRFLEVAGAVAGASATRPRPLAAASPPAAASTAITLACADYVRFLPIAAGDVRPAGVALTWLRGDRSEMLRRATADSAVHGGEASMAQHLLRVDRGDRSLVAIPIFPLRNFTARDLYVTKGSSLAPAALSGRRLGIYNWAASGAVWYRHLVRHLGNDPSRISWIVGSPDSTTPVNVAVPLPPNVSLAPAGKSLSDLLLAGEIDALFAPLPPGRHDDRNGPIVRLMADYRAVERQYFERTRCYPPQHVIVVHRPVWEANPAIGRPLVAVFDECETKFQAAQRLYPYATPWQIADTEETVRVLGSDYHAHGLERNRHAVDVFCQSGFEDGLTKRRVTVDEFFAEFVKVSSRSEPA